MKTTVYNIVWADDEIDTLLDAMTVEDMEQRGFGIIGRRMTDRSSKKS